MIYVHCRQPSEGAALLAEQLRELGLPTRRSRTIEELHKRVRNEDIIIGWGEFIPFAGMRILNVRPLPDKWEELRTLEKAGIPVPPHDLKNWGEGWLGRSLHHQEGGDFLLEEEKPPIAFFTRKLDIREEFRFHIFRFPEGLKSIRAGKRVPRSPEHHPWVRSWEAGWKISYGASRAPERGREMAKRAIAAAGYDFGAVDIGVLKGGEVVVLEVNSRPGFEVGGQTVEKYAGAIREVVK